MSSRRGTSSTPGPGRGKSRRGPKSSVPASKSTTRSTTRAAADSGADARAASRAKLTGRAAILLLVLAVLAVSYASSARAWLRQRGEINALNAEIASQQSDISALEQQQRRWHDPAYVQTMARLRFGWVMPGETGYRVISDDGETLSNGTSDLSDPVQPESSAPSEWWDDAWGSVVEAGADPEAKEPTKDRSPGRKPVERIGGKNPDG